MNGRFRGTVDRLVGVGKGAGRRASQDVDLIPRFLRSSVGLARTPILATSDGVRVIEMREPSGITNPSIAATPEGFVIAARTVPYRLSRLHRRGVPLSGASDEQTILCRVDRLDDELVTAFVTVAAPDGAPVGSFEDPRLFRWRGALRVLWTVSTPVSGGRHQNSMVMARITGSSVDEVTELPSPRASSREKNWMPLVRDDRLFFVYDLEAGETYEYVGEGGLVRVSESPRPHLAGESGSSQFIPFEDGWLGVSHRRIDRPSVFPWLPVAYYRHRLVLLDERFSIRRVSSPFFLTSRNVEFCAGLADDGDAVVLSFGIEDARAAILRVPRQLVERMLASPSSRASRK